MCCPAVTLYFFPCAVILHANILERPPYTAANIARTFSLFFISCGKTEQRFGDYAALPPVNFAEYSANLARLGIWKIKLRQVNIYRPRILITCLSQFREGLSRDPARGRTLLRFRNRIFQIKFTGGNAA